MGKLSVKSSFAVLSYDEIYLEFDSVKNKLKNLTDTAHTLAHLNNSTLTLYNGSNFIFLKSVKSAVMPLI